MTAAPRPASSGVPVRALAAIFVVGLALRLQLTIIGPILPRIQEDIDILHAAAGLLTSLPIMCMGLAAFFTSRLIARLGTTVTVGGALALVAVAGLARAAAPSAELIFLSTLFIGIGIGIGGASAPVFIKERLAGRPASATGIHVTAIIFGSVVVSAAAVPLTLALGSWRWPLAIASAATLLAAIGWVILAGQVGPARGAGHRRGAPWRRPIAWLLIVVFCGQSLIFFGLATWLPAAYVERGWSEAEAANLVAVLILFGLPASLGVGWLSDRFGSRRLYLVGSAGLSLICCLGFVLVPDAGLVWAAASGVGLGALFPLALTLPLDASAQPADVGPLTGLMLGVGYVVSSVAPVAMGAARDVVGSFTASLVLLAIAAGVLTLVSSLLTDARLASGRTAGLPPDAQPARAH